MGSIPHINGQLPGKRRPARAHRYVLRHAGNRIVVYACRSRHHCRPLDTGTKAVKLQSLHRSPVHGRSRILRHDERCGRGFRNPVHTLLAKRCFLYAYIGIVELRGLHRTRQSRTGYHQDIPSHTYFRHNRIHLLHVGGGPARTAK